MGFKELTMKGDLEFTEEELALLTDEKEFKIFLYSLHEEYDIYNVDELYEFYKQLRWFRHLKVLDQFKKEINGEV